MAYSTINKQTSHFNTLAYSGTGSSNAITGVGFQPDWTWIKQRNGTADHRIVDAVRGVTKDIYSNLTTAQGTNTNGLTAFGSDGFTVGSDGGYNGSSDTYASWNWKANGQGSSNTAGSINTTYTSVNTTAGFSISTYTGNGTSGATVGHGLGAVPQIIWVKALTGSNNWACYHVSIGATKYFRLNTNDAAATSTARWNDTAPTSSVFSIGNDCYGTTSVIQIDENYKNAIIHSLVSVLGHHHENLNEACVMINTGHSYPIGDMLLDLGLNVVNLQRTQQDYQAFERKRHISCESFSL